MYRERRGPILVSLWARLAYVFKPNIDSGLIMSPLTAARNTLQKETVPMSGNMSISACEYTRGNPNTRKYTDYWALSNFLVNLTNII